MSGNPPFKILPHYFWGIFHATLSESATNICFFYKAFEIRIVRLSEIKILAMKKL